MSRFVWTQRRLTNLHVMLHVRSGGASHVSWPWRTCSSCTVTVCWCRTTVACDPSPPRVVNQEHGKTWTYDTVTFFRTCTGWQGKTCENTSSSRVWHPLVEYFAPRFFRSLPVVMILCFVFQPHMVHMMNVFSISTQKVLARRWSSLHQWHDVALGNRTQSWRMLTPFTHGAHKPC